MDHNNKHLLPSFQFPATAAFAGLQNGNALVQLSQLSSQLSNLSTPMLPTSADLTAWAAAQQSQQWIDQAKMAMFPSLYLKGGLDYSQQSVELATQQNLAAQAAQVQQVQQNTSIFPAAVIAAKIGKMSNAAVQQEFAKEMTKHQSPLPQPLSSGPSSHPSTSTPYDIDVGGLSQPSSHHQEVVNHSPHKVLQAYEVIDENRPSTSTAVPSLPLNHDIFAPSISTSLSGVSQTIQQPWDLTADIMGGLFNNTNKQDHSGHDRKEREQEDDNLNFLFDDDAIIDDDQNKNGNEKDLFAIDVSGAGLSPIQFTPPDSPVGAGSGAAAETNMGFAQPDQPGPSHLNGTGSMDMSDGMERPTPVATPMLILPDARRPDLAQTPSSFSKRLTAARPPKPVAEPIYRKTEFVSRPVQKLNKVPVYKQKQKTLTALVDDGPKDDAYSFEDEEDHGICKLDPREKLDAEVKEKLSKIASQPAGSTKNIYVPGVGFAVPQEPMPQQDLWRHVVPKKRPIAENRPIIPAANLLPSSVHAEASEAAARLAEPEILSLAESIRRRKKERFVGSFVKFENTNSTDCVKQEKIVIQENGFSHSDENRPPLPKLIIKLPKRGLDSYEHKKKKKKKKKRRHEEEDSDWEDVNYRKRSKCRSERRESGYEIRVVEPTVSFKQEEEKPDFAMIPKKRRLMMQWQEGQEVRANGQHNSNASRAKAEFNTEAIKLRLSKFGPAEGHLPKGTFVVCKADLFRDDCALWKVDNQNMLQKYPPKVDPLTNFVSYKNSSTYSGWCEQIASGYYRVSVKHIKQTRSEAVVQPEIALSDLFPALTSECSDNNGVFRLDEDQNTDPNEHMNMLRDPLRLSLYTYTQAMLDHALTLDRLQAMKEKNDWSFLQAVSDIERANEDSIVRINQQVQMREEFLKLLQQYVQFLVIDHDAKEIHCQACSVEKRSVEKIVQLLCLDNYDRDSLTSQPLVVEEGIEAPLPACEMFVCSVCATAARQFHSCYHMSYHLLKKCEDRLELIGTQHPELSPERIIDVAKKTRGWQNNVFAEYVDMWKKIQNSAVASIAGSHTSAMSYSYGNNSSFSASNYI